MDLWLLVLLLAVVQPLLGYRRLARATSVASPVATAAKLRLYAVVAATQWALTLVCAWVLARRGLDFGDIGLAGRPPALAVVAAALGALGLLGTTVLGLRALWRDAEAKLPSHLARVARILPASPPERAAFLVVALTAGVCEEILYRGFLILAFDRVLPSTWLSLGVAALVFGVAHAYQGPRGMLGTGLLGGFLGLVYVLGGSLWPGIGLHAAVDLVNGYALGPLGRARAGGGPEGPCLTPVAGEQHTRAAGADAAGADGFPAGP